MRDFMPSGCRRIGHKSRRCSRGLSDYALAGNEADFRGNLFTSVDLCTEAHCVVHVRAAVLFEGKIREPTASVRLSVLAAAP